MKQTFRIPENCNATVEQVGSQIVVTFEPKVKEFKKGDIIVKAFKYYNVYVIYMCSGNSGAVMFNTEYDSDTNMLSIHSNIRSGWGYCSEFKLATPEQRQLLLSKLEENGYRFNEKTLELDRIKWEPKEGEKYCFINSYGFIQEEIHTWRTPLRTNSDLINCFKPNSLDQDKVKRLFAEFIQNVKYEHGIDY